MNIRKNIDYTEMYEALDVLMAQQVPQMELYWEIGKAVCRRTEKGAAVMASEYLNKHYPDVKGFSPRSLRRIRDFYRTYENHPALLSRAMKLCWTQNVVIMEADLTMELRGRYLKAAVRFGWSKSELVAMIAINAYDVIVLEDKTCSYNAPKTQTVRLSSDKIWSPQRVLRLSLMDRSYRLIKDKVKRRWYSNPFLIYREANHVYAM